VAESASDRPGDESSSLTEVADELGLDHRAIPRVTRDFVEIGAGQQLSVLIWGQAE
jgi:hypothetical protein